MMAIEGIPLRLVEGKYGAKVTEMAGLVSVWRDMPAWVYIYEGTSLAECGCMKGHLIYFYL